MTLEAGRSLRGAKEVGKSHMSAKEVAVGARREGGSRKPADSRRTATRCHIVPLAIIMRTFPQSGKVKGATRFRRGRRGGRSGEGAAKLGGAEIYQ